MAAELVYFSNARIELNREIALHQEHQALHDILAKYTYESEDKFEVRLAEIAAYCEVLLDGEYMPSDLDKIAEICTKRLIEKRIGVLLL